MLRSIRFWIAAALAVVLLGCIIRNAHTPAEQSSAPPAAWTERCTSASQTASGTSLTGIQSASAASDNTRTASAAEKEASEPDASMPEISDRKIRDITDKLREASQYSTDLIGWIYLADSDIDYPIVQGTDNQYYLHHAPDGRENALGTIFLSYQCAKDFSDRQNILYGHNMQSGMFGDIRHFKDPGQFSKHRYGWLFTMDSLYRIDFYALAIVSAYDEIYDVPAADSAAWQASLRANSLYYNEPQQSDDCAVIALSTCASDFENARALFTGQLVRIREIDLT